MFSKITTKTLIMAVLFSAASSAFVKNARADKAESAKVFNHVAPEISEAERQLSFWDLPYLKHAFISTAPSDRKDGVFVGQLAGKKDKFVKLAQEIADGKHGLYDSVLVSHQNKLVFESYYRRARIDLSHGQASAVKAYTSLALGRAIQLGYLTMADLDKPLVSFLKQLDHAKLVAGAENITLHKALTMRGGIRVTEEQREQFVKQPRKLKGQGHVQVILETSKPITVESQQYAYGNYNPTLVMQVIDAVVPGSAMDFIKHELLDKMAINNYDWQVDISGLPEAGWRVSFTSRDMLKWGALMANKGKWQGEQLISAEYLAKATEGIVKPTQDWMPESYLYGYFIYQTNIAVGDKSYNANFAWGGGGQYVITLPELELIVVVTGHDREDKIMEQIAKNIVPAFVG